MLQCVSTCSSCDSAIKQKTDILQSEERQEEDCKICDRQVHEVALRPLDQTQGTKLLVFKLIKNNISEVTYYSLV